MSMRFIKEIRKCDFKTQFIKNKFIKMKHI